MLFIVIVCYFHRLHKDMRTDVPHSISGQDWGYLMMMMSDTLWINGSCPAPWPNSAVLDGTSSAS